METLHATCVVLDNKGILLCGPPGSGKSDLALRLIDGGAVLVADDLVALRVHSPPPDGGGREAYGAAVSRTGEGNPPSPVGERQLVAYFPNAPESLKGALEVRGLGIVRVPYQDEAEIHLCVELHCGPVERLPVFPLPHSMRERGIPTLTLNPFEASAPAKIRAALQRERVEV